MGRFVLTIIIAIAVCANAQLVSKAPLPEAEVATPDTIYDTVYVSTDRGIPYDRTRFNPDRLLRHNTFDPALSVAYTYSVSFISGPLGSLSQTSYLAHLNYEFTPNLHLFADMGLWMPLYSTIHTPGRFEREDLRQGNVQFVLPDIGLEYKPSENTYMRVLFVNENDAIKSYGPWRDPFYPHHSYRNSRFGN
ncbi:MAG: hypothetical protein MJY99_03000 [Fibrobacter sp.]|uniref:hypothetical protein n=1 Tax=Fibrobacter sp. TaxID=35828 RepID=UPI003891127C|nr:hypothetical protein [Fibrobacter sp.]